MISLDIVASDGFFTTILLISMSLSPALSLTDLKKTYANGTPALQGVSFDVAQGEIFALLGANGAGKTTLIGILCGLVEKTSGHAEVFGVDLDREPERLRSFLGVVPQEFNFNIFEKVQDIVVDAAGYYGVSFGAARKQSEVILREVGLWEKRDQVSRALSGGMKRRLLIARALMHQPKLLLLDEPSAGVDVELRREMWKYIERLRAQGMTIILTTHYLEEAEQLCKNVVILKEGRVARQGAIQDLLTQSGAHSLEALYLETHTSTPV